MKQEHVAYLRARELESYFREKVDLHYKGQNGVFSEYEVTQVNNRAVNYPITVGFCQFPNDASLYLHTDMAEDREGTAKIEFDLSAETLQGLRSGKSKLLFLESLQSAISDRPFANVDDLAGQSFGRYLSREAVKTLEHPLQQAMDLFKGVLSNMPGQPFRKSFGNTVKQASPEHIISVESFWSRANPGLRNTSAYSSHSNVESPQTPIIVRSDDLSGYAYLKPNTDYELTFSRYSRDGIPYQRCNFATLDPEGTYTDNWSLEYDGIMLAENGLKLHLDTGQVMNLSIVNRDRSQDREVLSVNSDERGTEDIHSDRTDQLAPSPAKGMRSLDQMIASAQSKANQQSIQQSKQRGHIMSAEFER